jgi:cytosine/adenosine deaminase-related metal-dependent hydrolase
VPPRGAAADGNDDADVKTIVAISVSVAAILLLLAVAAGIIMMRRAKGERRTAVLAKHFEASAEFTEIYQQMAAVSPGGSPRGAAGAGPAVMEQEADGTRTLRVSAPARSRAEVLAEL